MLKQIAVTLLLLSSVTTYANSFYSCGKGANGLEMSELGKIKSRALKVGDKVETQANQAFDVNKYKGKTVAFLVSATWCTYCKYDIVKTMEHRAKADFPKDDVVVVHMVVKSGRQDLIKSEKFLAEPRMRDYVLDLEGTDYYYSEDLDFSGFKDLKRDNGEAMFPELRGTPYAVIFDKNGKAQFRGHYTNQSDDHSAYYDSHYNFIKEVAEGKCK